MEDDCRKWCNQESGMNRKNCISATHVLQKYNGSQYSNPLTIARTAPLNAICHEKIEYFLFSKEIEMGKENTGTLNDRLQPPEKGINRSMVS